jgi:hypothetical protein
MNGTGTRVGPGVGQRPRSGSRLRHLMLKKKRKRAKVYFPAVKPQVPAVTPREEGQS